MSVLQTDLKLYHCLLPGKGGGIDTANKVDITNLKNNIFGPVTAKESEAGFTDYRCIFLKNESATNTLKDAHVYLEATPDNTQIHIFLGAANLGNVQEPTITNFTDIPAGIAFQRAEDVNHAVNLGDIASNSSQGFWLKRTVDPGAKADDLNSFIITVFGETD
jgi:hypothetical protein